MERTDYVQLVEILGIDLTVVGPEAPLVGGIVDNSARAASRSWVPRQRTPLSKAARFIRSDSCSIWRTDSAISRCLPTTRRRRGASPSSVFRSC